MSPTLAPLAITLVAYLLSTEIAEAIFYVLFRAVMTFVLAVLLTFAIQPTVYVLACSYGCLRRFGETGSAAVRDES